MKTDTVLIVNAVCEVTYIKTTKNHTSTIYSIRRGLNIAVSQENLAQSTSYIFNNLQTNLDLLQETNKEVRFRPILGVDIIASVSKVKLGESEFLEKFRFDSNNCNPSLAIKSVILPTAGSKRKALSPLNESLFIIPRDYEMGYQMTHIHV